MKSDKLGHLVVGAGIAIAIGLLTCQWIGPQKAAVAGLAVGILAGAIKEGVDSTGRGTVEAADFMFTGAGAALGAVLVWMVG
jgi:uncharacterized membrane protein YccC